MDGGKNPIRDGDYLLLELVSPTRAGSITGNVVAIERQDESAATTSTSCAWSPRPRTAATC